mgnify:CR=1 FL=1
MQCRTRGKRTYVRRVNEARERLQRVLQRWEPPSPQLPEPLVLDAPRRRFSGRTTRIVIAVMLALLMVAGWSWWSGRARPVIAAPSVSSSGQADLAGSVVVHVVGEVKQPGTVSLPAGSRVEDAVEAAGGVTKQRSLESVNLARLLVDGEQIVLGEPPKQAAGGGGSSDGGVVSLNAATVTELDALPGVGPVLAQRIIDWRTAHGGFKTLEDLNNVSGIGDATMADIVPLVVL